MSAEDGAEVLEIAEKADFSYAEVENLGKVERNDTYFQKQIDMILALPLVDAEAIRKAGFRAVVDAVNSTDGIVVPQLLKALGVVAMEELLGVPNGDYPNNR